MAFAAAHRLGGGDGRRCLVARTPESAMTQSMVETYTLGAFPTPLTRLHRIERAMNLGPLYAKRDDLSGFGLAGNKTRPLQYLVAGALRAGSDVFVTGGRADSNFCAAAAAAARSAGLACVLVIATASGTPEFSANLRLARSSGAAIVWVQVGGSGIDDAIRTHADKLAASGRTPYAVPRGGSTPLGAMGFADAAGEITDQLTAAGIADATVVCALGSGGSCAGLLVGRAELAASWRLIGVSVSRPIAELTNHLAELTTGCARLRGGAAPDLSGLTLVDATDLPHGVMSAAQRELALTAYRHEGLLIEASYTARALEVAVRHATENRDRATVFWHTGGTLAAVSGLFDVEERDG
jgi:1-aminocyclopropane-1-carboxylate deaminase/D-cysteine desulfhydrase-like pyridoxal-dependent ACC family enzyme